MQAVSKIVNTVVVEALNGPRLKDLDIYSVGSFLLEIIESDFLSKYFDSSEYSAYTFLRLDKKKPEKQYHRIYFFVSDKKRILHFFNECAKKYNTSFLFFLTALNLDKKFPREWWEEYLWASD